MRGFIFFIYDDDTVNMNIYYLLYNTVFVSGPTIAKY